MEKAFGNVNFKCLLMTMSKMGFTGPFSHLITAIYTAPAARLVAAGLLSDEFHLHKCTRQGCPLSLLLFKLALEPLSRFLTRHSPTALDQHWRPRTSLFADDVLIFSANPSSDMSTIKIIFDDFRLCSGLCINYGKKILPIGTLSNPTWTSRSPFMIAKSHTTYLRIKIGKLPSSI